MSRHTATGRTTWITRRTATLAGAILLAGVALGWALNHAFTSPEDTLQNTTHVTVTAQTGERGESLTLNTTAQWTPTQGALNRAAGTLTALTVANGDKVKAGDVLYRVDNRPVVIAAGNTPAYRDLRPGDSGPDVKQLAALLNTLGYSVEPTQQTIDSQFTAAIHQWHKDLGVPRSETVTAGDVLYVPTLPTRVAYAPDAPSIGAVLTGQDPLILTVAAEPAFHIDLTTAQAQRITTGNTVTITPPTGDPWIAEITTIEPNTDGGHTATLGPQNSDSICGKNCNDLAVDTPTYLPTALVITPPVSGTIVPLAALTSGTDNTLHVTTTTNDTITVELLAAVRGEAIVDGLEAGTDILVPVESDHTP